MSTSDAPELLVCDTSFVGLVAQRHRKPERVAHWDAEVLRRIERARNAISVFTLAEARAGHLMAQFTRKRIEQEERRLQAFGLLPLDDEVLAEWIRLRAATTDRTVPHNDLWIAATAAAHRAPLVSCDRHHLHLRELLPEVIYLPARPDAH
jgi:predicted nucleic acid-binding protein